MIITLLQRFLWMVGLVAAQMIVFNRVHFFGYATPLPYVYFLLLFPLGTQRWVILLWSFLCALLADMTTLAPGVGTSAMTLTAFIQPLLLMLAAPKDAAEDMQASYRTMGFWPYARYASILTAIFVSTYFLVIAFSFHHFFDWLVSMVSSWLLTLMLCLIFEGFRSQHGD